VEQEHTAGTLVTKTYMLNFGVSCPRQNTTVCLKLCSDNKVSRRVSVEQPFKNEANFGIFINFVKLYRCKPSCRLGGEEVQPDGEWSTSRLGRALLPRMEPPLPTVQEAGWAPEPVRTQRLEEKILCSCRRSKAGRLVRSQSLY
jgi:hypothetical protein